MLRRGFAVGFALAATSALVLLLSMLGSGPGPAQGQETGGLPNLAARVADLEALVESLQSVNTDQTARFRVLTERLAVVEAKTAPIGVFDDDFVITGKNVYIVDGSGDTESDSGLGNLIVGYNENGSNGDDHTGTHNLVVGRANHCSSFGGLVAGEGNQILGPYCTITGGTGNTARNYWSSVNGGFSNLANGQGTVVNGGQQNRASESYATVSGGYLNVVTAFRGWAGGAYHTP